MKGVVVCVNYDDLLKITLPQNLQNMEECLVITSPADTKTQELASQYPKCKLHVTDAFYRYGAIFNKGLAIEESFDVLGREGWILIWDADILMPKQKIYFNHLNPDVLYGARRRILNDPRQYHSGFNWQQAPIHYDRVWPGYFQLFNADDSHLIQRPWYDVTFAHAGGGDGAFQDRWKENEKARLSFEVLHLGPIDTNWMGRATDRLDGEKFEGQQKNQEIMDNYVRHKGWKRGSPPNQPILERVIVPGHSPTGFKVGGKD